MSRNPKPTVEELRFVYQMILNGYEDSDILVEYARLYESGQLMFPPRTDKRFIRERRKELDAVLEVAKDHLEKKADPIIKKRLDEHFTKLSDVAMTLLSNDLNRIGKHLNNDGGVEYHLFDENEVILRDKLTEENLSAIFDDNYCIAYKEHTEWFVNECFIPHLEAEWGEELKNKGFYCVALEHPFLLIETLRLVAARKIFKGTCPVCKDWY